MKKQWLVGMTIATLLSMSLIPDGAQAGLRVNGMRVNGMRVNGMRVNGMRVNGMRVNGMRVNGPDLQGVNLLNADQRLQVQDGQLVIVQSEP